LIRKPLFSERKRRNKLQIHAKKHLSTLFTMDLFYLPVKRQDLLPLSVL